MVGLKIVIMGSNSLGVLGISAYFERRQRLHFHWSIFLFFQGPLCNEQRKTERLFPGGRGRGMLNAHYQIFVPPCPDLRSHNGTYWHQLFKT